MTAVAAGLLVRAVVAVRGVDAQVEVAPGETVALLGPNGAGKSTLLAVAAGLLRPDAGRVELAGRVLLDIRGPRRRGPTVDVAPHRRGIALLAQEPLLFPHLTAAANVAFGPRSAGAGRSASAAAATAWLERVDAAHLAGRRPAELSGGQAQRVAVARALAAGPRALLLDEPMAALDVTAAPALRQLLRRVLGGELLGDGQRGAPPTTLLVTHDPLDALALADRAIVIDGGRVVESGPVREVLARPRSAFAAQLAGLNLVPGTARTGGLTGDDGSVVGGVLDTGCAPGDAAVAVFAPSAVAVHREPSGPGRSSPRTALPVVVAAVEPRGPLVRVRAAERDGGAPGLAADVTVEAAADLDLAPGAQVWFAVKAAEVAVHALRRPTPPGEGPSADRPSGDQRPGEAQASSSGR